MFTDIEGFRHGLQQLFGALLPIGAAGCLGADHKEFITAQPGDGVTLAHPRLQALRGVAQQFVAGCVTQRIVHVFESVQVDEQRNHAAAIPLGPFDGLGKPVHRQTAVRQPGELVIIRLMGQLLFRFDAFVDLPLQTLVLLMQ